MASRWLPLDSVLVRYVDDPDLYHHRMVLKGLEGDRAWVVTPDRETFVTELATGETYDDIKRMHTGRLPMGLTEDDTSLAKHSEQELVRKADSESQPRPARRITGKLDEQGVRQPVGGLRAPTGEQVESPGQVWVVVYSSTGDRLGEIRWSRRQNRELCGWEAWTTGCFPEAGRLFWRKGSPQRGPRTSAIWFGEHREVMNQQLPRRMFGCCR